MIAHVAEFHAPSERLETVGMRGFHERVVPVLESQPGFAATSSCSAANRES